MGFLKNILEKEAKEAEEAKIIKAEEAKKAAEEKAIKDAEKAEAKAAALAAKEAIKKEFKEIQDNAYFITTKGYIFSEDSIKKRDGQEINVYNIDDISYYDTEAKELSSYLKVVGGFIEPQYKGNNKVQIILNNYDVIDIEVNDNMQKMRIIKWLKDNGIAKCE